MIESLMRFSASGSSLVALGGGWADASESPAPAGRATPATTWSRAKAVGVAHLFGLTGACQDEQALAGLVSAASVVVDDSR